MKCYFWNKKNIISTNVKLNNKKTSASYNNIFILDYI